MENQETKIKLKR